MNKTNVPEPRLCVTCEFGRAEEKANKSYRRVCSACVARSKSSVEDQTDPNYAPNWRKVGSRDREYMPGLKLRAGEALETIANKKPIFWQHKFELHTWMEHLHLKTIIEAAERGILFETIKIEK